MAMIGLVLFGAAMLGGASERFLGKQVGDLRYPLIFAGSFLFSITVVHILPEVFSISEEPMKIGFYVLIGFFFQQFLEYFTSGIEHGHAHKHVHMGTGARAGLMAALVIHSFLEGALLMRHSPLHDEHEGHSLLIGIALHKMPAAFALAATLKEGRSFGWKVWSALIVFGIASPIGLILGNAIISLSPDILILLFAFVAGSFLHISTTIFVETSPNHHFDWRKLIIGIFGALTAAGTEFFF